MVDCRAKWGVMAEVDLPLDIKSDNLPLITIVTVVFNGERFIEETINSVLAQSYPNIEYVIIDGGSSDRTLDIIRKYEYAIDYWSSGPDLGIYDAMNKGISAARGQWINFMNAGDSFYSSDTVFELFSSPVESEVIVLYGNVNARYDGFSKVVYPGRLQNLWLGLQFCHQSAFVASDYIKHNRFNANNKITADLEFFYSSYLGGCRFHYVNVVVANFRTGGISEGNRIATIVSSWRTVKMFRGGIHVCLAYFSIILMALFSVCAKKLLPRWLVKLIIVLK